MTENVWIFGIYSRIVENIFIANGPNQYYANLSGKHYYHIVNQVFKALQYCQRFREPVDWVPLNGLITCTNALKNLDEVLKIKIESDKDY